MKIAYIIYHNYLTPDGSKMSVGGIQTYISNLIPILLEAGYRIHLYQRAINDFEVKKEDVLITGLAIKGNNRKFINHIRKILLKIIDKEKDLLVFGSEAYSFDSKEYRSIAIQHGIYWDKPSKRVENRLKYFYVFFTKCLKSWFIIERVSRVRHLVCVDFNFVNWYRSLVAYPTINLSVIPNFTQIPQSIPMKHDGKVNIIFARRFFEHRGTRLFAEAIKPILEKRDDISVTIAGEGPDEKFLHDILDSFPQVSFIKYSSKDSMNIHAPMHIAVVPTLGSEGTSLSLLEAMASGCAVICTNVGGMTNIVLDYYNGLMISPTPKELRIALLSLIDDEKLRRCLGAKAYETASKSFSLKKWQETWRKTIVEAGM